MARLFDDAAGDELLVRSAVLTNEPITMACWFYADDNTIVVTLLALAVAGSNSFIRLFLHGAAAGDPVGAQKQDGGTTGFATTTTGFSLNTWHHAAGVWTGDASRTAYIDGGSSGSETTNVADVAYDRTLIGANINSASPERMSGRIAEPAIWDVELTAAEIAALAQGYSPLLVRPASLIFHPDLIRPVLDKVGGYAITVTGTTAAAHPRVFNPKRRSVVTAPAAAAASVTRRQIPQWDWRSPWNWRPCA